MTVLVKAILFGGVRTTLACDGGCRKAFGVSRRPRVRLSDDPDDYAFLADPEVGEAPTDPGTYEGGCGKPTDYADPRRQNRWCVRECERSELIEQGPVVLPDYSRRLYNQPWKHPEATGGATP